jgi:hypothetical protein
MFDSIPDKGDKDELHERLRRCLSGSQDALLASIRETMAQLEQATVDGVITDDRSDYEATIDAIDISSVADYGARFDELRQIRCSLDSRREQRFLTLHQKWQELDAELNRLGFSPTYCEHVRILVEAALDRKDTRVLEEITAQILEAVDVAAQRTRSCQHSRKQMPSA